MSNVHNKKAVRPFFVPIPANQVILIIKIRKVKNNMPALLKNKETRNKILLIVALLILIRIGSIIPIPGINASYMQQIMSNQGFAFLNMITGNSMSHMSFFALSISPYITASIIIQLMTTVIPVLEEMTKDGKTGQERIQKITNMVGILLAFVQALMLSIGLGNKGLLEPYTWWMVICSTAIWTAGATVLIFIGEKITKLELGNGISYILLLNILSTFPGDILTLYERFINGQSLPKAAVSAAILFAVISVLIVICILLNTTETAIPMSFSRKMEGVSKKQELPIPLNICSVMPIIFTGSIFSIPTMIAQFFPGATLFKVISPFTNQSQWFNPDNIIHTAGCVPYILLTFFFASFYLEISFNTNELAQNLKSQGATVNGIRPGKPTAEYLHVVASRMAKIGTTIVIAIILTSVGLCNMSGLAMLSIGGTSMLICVNIIIESSKKLKTASISVKNRSRYMKTSRKNRLFIGKGVKK